jgi:hypothetical protein
VSISSLKVVGAGVLAFSFTLHSCFIGITDWMSLKCSSLSFLTASSLIFYAFIRWILLLRLDVRLGGYQRGVGAVLRTIVFRAPFYTDPEETGCPVSLLLGIGHCLSTNLCLLALGLVLLPCNLLWTFLHVVLCLVIC